MTSRTHTKRSWWMTADTAAGAAAQLPLWLALMAASMFAVLVDPNLSWWFAICAWTAGLVASAATSLVRSGVIPERVARRKGAAGTFSWGMLVVSLGLVVVTALTLLVSTGNPIALVTMLIVGAAAVRVAVHGSGQQQAAVRNDMNTD